MMSRDRRILIINSRAIVINRVFANVVNSKLSEPVCESQQS